MTMNLKTISGPLLSICIPTYNRCAVLKEALESITSQDGFSRADEVEVVVSDNASTDDTPNIVAEFVNRFPGKVTYFRQETNVWTANFHQALSLGRGQYLKLHNDTLLIRENALAPLLDAIRQCSRLRPVIVMTNGNRVKEGKALLQECQNLDELIENVSFFSTWIGGFGLWREDLPLAEAFRHDTNHLVQTGLVCKQMAEGRPAVAFFGNYFISKQDFRGTYNWTEVFGKNFLGILKQYVATGNLSAAVFERTKREVLLRQILPNYFKTTNVYDKANFFENLSDYRDDGYFYEAIAKHLPLLWRFNNSNNKTELRSASDSRLLACARIGAQSRGDVNLMGRYDADSRLDIGSFVTLEEGVGFILGEDSPQGDSFSTFWAAAPLAKNRDITVGDDVWIGRGALLLSGCSVGQGAIIEAGSVVTGEIPAYSRVAGNPAQVIEYRFEPVVIEKLSTFDFSTLSESLVANLGAWMRVPLNSANIDAFMQNLLEARKAPVTPPTREAAGPVSAVLILDSAGDTEKINASLSELAAGPYGDFPVVVLTTYQGEVPEWSNRLRYLQAGADEYSEVAEQLRMLADFKWVCILGLA